MRTWTTRGLAPLAVILALGGCEQVEKVQDHYRDVTPREAYAASLRQAGLTETALGHDWMQAGAGALERPSPVTLPFEEEGVITAERPSAMAYRIHIGRGQKLRAEATLSSDEDALMFVELFRIPADSTDPFRPVVWADSTPGPLIHEPWRSGDFILRLQPELLRGGRYRVRLRLEAQLAFPVEGRTIRAVQSGFGAPREGGRRRHEGIDIFAPRGTPVLAAAAGVVSRVRVTTIGGKVVWVRDPVRGASEYYAHLDSQVVHPGQPVAVGDTLGFVGNTGNARTTPTHLHFGLYRRGEGAVDPYPFVRPPSHRPVALTADLGSLGAWAYVRDSGIRLRAAPDLRSEVLQELEDSDALRVLAGSGEWYRVRLGDGSVGYVSARLVRSRDGDGSAAASGTGRRP